VRLKEVKERFQKNLLPNQKVTKTEAVKVDEALLMKLLQRNIKTLALP
jgi:hypothetical protein